MGGMPEGVRIWRDRKDRASVVQVIADRRPAATLARRPHVRTCADSTRWAAQDGEPAGWPARSNALQSGELTGLPATQVPERTSYMYTVFLEVPAGYSPPATYKESRLTAPATCWSGVGILGPEETSTECRRMRDRRHRSSELLPTDGPSGGWALAWRRGVRGCVAQRRVSSDRVTARDYHDAADESRSHTFRRALARRSCAQRRDYPGAGPHVRLRVVRRCGCDDAVGVEHVGVEHVDVVAVLGGGDIVKVGAWCACGCTHSSRMGRRPQFSSSPRTKASEVGACGRCYRWSTRP
jgi:hypothetical protein